MKIAGKKIEGLNEEHILIPRGDDEPIYFTARAVINFDEFDNLCPQPKPRMLRGRDGKSVPKPNDSIYEQAIENWAAQRLGYMVIKSLSATEGLEFEKLNINDPNTYQHWREEFSDAGFSDTEISRILNGVLAACGLDETKVKAARERFLTTRQAELLERNFPREEAPDTQSGELASDSE